MSAAIQKVSHYGSLLKAAIIVFVSICILGYAVYLIVSLYRQLNSNTYVRDNKTAQPESNGSQAGAQTPGKAQQSQKESGQGSTQAQGSNIAATA